MASLVNAVRNIMSDGWWFIKIAVLMIPVYLIMENEQMQSEILGSNLPVLFVLCILYLGCASVMMNRNINNKTPILPGILTIPEIIIKSVGCAICMFPGAAILAFCCSFIKANIVLEEPFAMFVLYTCVVIFFVPFILIPAVLYSVNGKITDAAKINKVFAASGNFVVAFLSFVIQYLFMFLLFAFLIYRVLIEMLGEGNPGIPVLYAFVIVVTFLLIFSFSSDLYEDVIHHIKLKRDIL